MDEFCELVKQMREAQKRYFRTRDANDLNESKRLEREVDKAIKDYVESKLGGLLFDE